MFFGENYVVTFHLDQLQELELARESIIRNPTKWDEGHVFTAHQVIDKVVVNYFPILYKIEDHLNDIEEKLSPTTIHLSMDFVFDVRSDLLRLRRTIIPMRELLYRMLNSEQLAFTKHERAYFSDIHDHLLRLAEILEMNRELTADIRDSQLSINSNQMNRIMMMLTIISDQRSGVPPSPETNPTTVTTSPMLMPPAVSGATQVTGVAVLAGDGDHRGMLSLRVSVPLFVTTRPMLARHSVGDLCPSRSSPWNRSRPRRPAPG